MLSFLLMGLLCGVARAADQPEWVAPMRQVHAKFSGKAGTFAQFGDSITVTMAYWAPLRYERKKLDEAGTKAFDRVSKHMAEDCWAKWKGPDYGSDGSKTIRWAHENIDRWVKSLNPEVALIMFGTNDLGQLDVAEYRQKTAEVVDKCLANGTVVILSTIPPRSGQLDKCRKFAEATRELAREKKVPLVDYLEECLKRRSDDWDGTLPKFKGEAKDVYQVPTLIAADGVHPSNPKKYANDYSEEGLRSNGYVLRNYLTLKAYDEMIVNVLRPDAR
jgi:lysophospholipase L1-like esterase